MKHNANMATLFKPTLTLIVLVSCIALAIVSPKVGHSYQEDDSGYGYVVYYFKQRLDDIEQAQQHFDDLIKNTNAELDEHRNRSLDILENIVNRLDSLSQKNEQLQDEIRSLEIRVRGGCALDY